MYLFPVKSTSKGIAESGYGNAGLGQDPQFGIENLILQLLLVELLHVRMALAVGPDSEAIRDHLPDLGPDHVLQQRLFAMTVLNDARPLTGLISNSVGKYEDIRLETIFLKDWPSVRIEIAAGVIESDHHRLGRECLAPKQVSLHIV